MGIIAWSPSGPLYADPIPAGSVALDDLAFDPATQAELSALHAWAVAVIDSATDHTAAVNAALAAIGTAGGGICRLARGSSSVCLTSATLTIPAGVVLWIEPGVTIQQKAGTAVAGIRLNGANAGILAMGGATLDMTNNTTTRGLNDNGTGVVTVAFDDCSVEGLTILSPPGWGIHASNMNRFRATRNRVSNAGGFPIFVEATVGAAASVDSVVVENNYVDQRAVAAASIAWSGIGVYSDLTTAFTVGAVKVTGNTVHMPVSPTNINAVCITTRKCPGAVLSGNHTYGGSMGLSIDNSNGSQATGNHTFNASLYGIEVPQSKGVTVTGNTVDGNARTTHGITLDAGSPAVDSFRHVIATNTVTGCVNYGISVQTGSGRASVTANTVLGGTPLIVQGGRGAIVGNILDANSESPSGIVLQNSSNFTVAGNLVSGPTTQNVLLSGTVAGTIDSITIVGNDFDTTKTDVASSLSGGAALGNRVKVFANNGIVNAWNFTQSTRHIVDFNDPNGNVGAWQGSTFQRVNPGTAHGFFYKATGLSTSGWVPFVTMRRVEQTLSTSGAVTINAGTADHQAVVLQANATSSSITNAYAGQLLTIEWIQDATGSRTYAWPTNCRFAGAAAPTATTTASRRDSVTFRYDGTNWYETGRAVAVG